MLQVVRIFGNDGDAESEVSNGARPEEFDMNTPAQWLHWVAAVPRFLVLGQLTQQLGAAIPRPGTSERFDEARAGHRNHLEAISFLVGSVNDANARNTPTGHAQLSFLLMADLPSTFLHGMVGWYLGNGSFLSTAEYAQAGQELPPLLPLDAAIEKNKGAHNLDPIKMHGDPLISQLLAEIVSRGLDVGTCATKFSVEGRTL